MFALAERHHSWRRGTTDSFVLANGFSWILLYFFLRRATSSKNTYGMLVHEKELSHHAGPISPDAAGREKWFCQGLRLLVVGSVYFLGSCTLPTNGQPRDVKGQWWNSHVSRPRGWRASAVAASRLLVNGLLPTPSESTRRGGAIKCTFAMAIGVAHATWQEETVGKAPQTGKRGLVCESGI